VSVSLRDDSLRWSEIGSTELFATLTTARSLGVQMDQMTHEAHGQEADPHAGHKMSKAHGNHDRHAGHSVAMFRDKFWLSFALTIPVVFWSTDVQHWLGYTAPSFPGSKFIPAILGTVVFVYGGLVFIRGAWRELADRKPGMMTLISLAIIVAFGTSLAATFGLFEIEVWWELASLITIMVLGHWLEMRAISQARGALNALAALLPDTAERVSGTETQTVPLSELKVGDVVLVRPGARVPADGTVVEGSADVDESMITGESRTVSKGPGGKVIAGTVAVAEAFESVLRQSGSRPLCPASCGSLPLRRLLGLARKISPTVQPQSFSM
jgi:Cu2+-exporting ATPase